MKKHTNIILNYRTQACCRKICRFICTFLFVNLYAISAVAIK
ncbi:UNVERIFIED_CONTAM: hypothetical protein GTU68_032664 [Idotea baltica]|nr:hypothetical protein [Idotea baltica]